MSVKSDCSGHGDEPFGRAQFSNQPYAEYDNPSLCCNAEYTLCVGVVCEGNTKQEMDLMWRGILYAFSSAES